MLLFAPCPRGLEDLLSRELAVIGAQRCRVVPGGVSFEGDTTLVYQVNLYSRLASRVLRQVGAGRYRDEDEIFRVARRVEWDRFMHCGQTLRVDTTAVRSPLRSLNFANLRVKDAVVDRLRETQGDRPSIDTLRPDVRVFAFLNEQDITLYLDTSGESLFKRGWRRDREDKGIAPLKENLAAGLLALAGWTPDKPLFDPYCGSGTLLIEAAQLAMGIAPGLSRAFAFEKLVDHDADLWSQLRGDAIREAQQFAAQAAGSLRIPRQSNRRDETSTGPAWPPPASASRSPTRRSCRRSSRIPASSSPTRPTASGWMRTNRPARRTRKAASVVQTRRRPAETPIRQTPMTTAQARAGRHCPMPRPTRTSAPWRRSAPH